jgi:capsular exopolysaccharide synthesis family protein
MSEFFKALGQAERDRALREQARDRKASAESPAVLEETPSAPAPPAPVAAAPVVAPSPPAPAVPVAPAAPAAPSPFMTARRATPPPETFMPDADEPFEGIDGHLVSLVTPATFEAEQYRALRHTIEELRAASGLAIVAVSSPSVGDGKTTTAINLAGALAQSAHAKVLLIDADLRAPTVRDKLGLREVPSPGLVGAIVDRRVSLADAVRRRLPFAMDILPAGDRPTAPFELLKSSRLTELFREARAAYDYVIVDTPPLVAVPDCRVLAGVVDGFIIVVTAHRTPKRLVEEALNVVEPSKTIGIVYNGDERPLSGYYSRQYGPSTNGNGNGHRKWRWGRR